MREINWDYIAGFFDGEGCVECRQRASGSLYLRIRWAQAEEHSWVLHEIQTFLSEYGINASFETRTMKGKNYCWLSVCALDSIEFVLRKMMPSLIVKRRQASYALKMYSNWRYLQRQYGKKSAASHFYFGE